MAIARTALVAIMLEETFAKKCCVIFVGYDNIMDRTAITNSLNDCQGRGKDFIQIVKRSDLILTYCKYNSLSTLTPTCKSLKEFRCPDIMIR
jgi:hypothetical protein